MARARSAVVRSASVGFGMIVVSCGAGAPPPDPAPQTAPAVAAPSVPQVSSEDGILNRHKDARKLLVFGEVTSSGDDAFGVCRLFQKEVDRDPQSFLKSWPEPVYDAIEALRELHPDPYDMTHGCRKKVEAKLQAEADAPIKRTEDDRQYATRVREAKERVEGFQRAMDHPEQASPDDMLFACGEITKAPFSVFKPAMERVQARRRYGREPRNTPAPSEEEKDITYCRRAFITNISPWVSARYADYQKGRKDEKAQAERAQRQGVLDRRFGPVEEECVRTWSESEQCQSLQGLEPDEREQCKKRCASKRQEAFNSAVKAAHDTCVDQFVAKGGTPSCVLKRPDKSTMAEAAITSALTSCTAECRKDGPQAKADAQRREQAEREPRRSGSSTSKAPARTTSSGASCCAKCGGSWVPSPGACPGADNLCFMCCVGTAPASACGGR